MGSCLKIIVIEVMSTDEAPDSSEDSDASSIISMPLNPTWPVMLKYQPSHRAGSAFSDAVEVNSSISRLWQPYRSATLMTDGLGIPKPVTYNSQSSIITDFGNIPSSTIHSQWSTECSWRSTPRSQTPPDIPITKVTSQLYIGSYEGAKNEKLLLSRAITHTLCLIGPKHVVAGIQHKHNPMSDWGKTDLKILINNIWTFVEESQQPGKALFVHCLSGQNRSATIVIAILMKHHNWSLEGAFKILKNKRPIVHINENYAKQLSKMEEDIHGRNSVTKNWMEIKIVNMSTGSVYFFGDSMSNVDCKYNQKLEGNTSKEA